MLLNREKLESLLLANWTKFIDYRKLMQIISDTANKHLGGQYTVHKMTLTRFEYAGEKFVIWIEYTVVKGTEMASLTSEFHIKETDFLHIETVNS
jgi:hypothetical protein